MMPASVLDEVDRIKPSKSISMDLTGNLQTGAVLEIDGTRVRQRLASTDGKTTEKQTCACTCACRLPHSVLRNESAREDVMLKCYCSLLLIAGDPMVG